jgi:hypothetical protein
MRLGLLALVAFALLMLLRRRRPVSARVVVAWRDGTEVGLAEGTAEHGRIVGAAERALT